MNSTLGRGRSAAATCPAANAVVATVVSMNSRRVTLRGTRGFYLTLTSLWSLPAMLPGPPPLHGPIDVHSDLRRDHPYGHSAAGAPASRRALAADCASGHQSGDAAPLRDRAS